MIDSPGPRYLAYVNPASMLAGAQAAQSALIECANLAVIQQPVAHLNTTFQGARSTQPECADEISGCRGCSVRILLVGQRQ